MAVTLVSAKTKQGQNGLETDYHYESFDEFYSDVPKGARNVVCEKEEGVWTTTFTVGGGSSETTGEPAEGEEATDPQANWNVNSSVSQEPLSTHRMFQAGGEYPIEESEWEKFKMWEKDHNDPALNGWPNGSGSSETYASAGMAKYLSYYNKGVESYLLASPTVKIITDNDVEPDCSMVGFIAVPEYKPKVAAGTTWLLVGIDANSSYGEAWKTTRDYRGSGPAGWDVDIYTKPAGE